jgi:hypothetical protein
MPNREFWYEEHASTPAMHGPGVTIAFCRSNSIVHSLRLWASPLRGDGQDAATSQVFVRSTGEDGAHELDPTRVLQPVYQELVPHELPEELGTGLCVLLTGSVFQHHFSAVFSLYRDRIVPSRVILDVDVADRCRAPIARLAATYDVDDQGAAHRRVDTSPSAVAWQFGPRGESMLELVAHPPATVAAEHSTSSSHRVHVDAAIDSRVHTQRLHYCWRWTN